MNKIIFLVMLLFLPPLYAEGDMAKYEAADHYKYLSEIYEKCISIANYQKAYEVAMKQLSIDPSDTVAYLRMALAAQHLDVDGHKLVNQYSSEISERDVFHKMIKSIANTLLEAPKCSDE